MSRPRTNHTCPDCGGAARPIQDNRGRRCVECARAKERREYAEAHGRPCAGCATMITGTSVYCPDCAEHIACQPAAHPPLAVLAMPWRKSA